MSVKYKFIKINFLKKEIIKLEKRWKSKIFHILVITNVMLEFRDNIDFWSENFFSRGNAKIFCNDMKKRESIELGREKELIKLDSLCGASYLREREREIASLLISPLSLSSLYLRFSLCSGIRIRSLNELNRNHN